MGDVNDPLNYRGIAFTNTIEKIFTYILYSTLQEWDESNGILQQIQAEFRSNRGTIDNIFNLASIIDLQLRLKGNKVYVIFKNFKRAFVSIKHNLLWTKLYQNGIRTKRIRVIASIYSKAKACV